MDEYKAICLSLHEKVNCDLALKEINFNEELRVQAWVLKVHIGEFLDKIDLYELWRPDEIHQRILKELAEGISKPLAFFFENLCRTRKVPGD